MSELGGRHQARINPPNESRTNRGRIADFPAVRLRSRRQVAPCAVPATKWGDYSAVRALAAWSILNLGRSHSRVPTMSAFSGTNSPGRCPTSLARSGPQDQDLSQHAAGISRRRRRPGSGFVSLCHHGAIILRGSDKPAHVACSIRFAKTTCRNESRTNRARIADSQPSPFVHCEMSCSHDASPPDTVCRRS
jgi:hypothetical protein